MLFQQAHLFPHLSVGQNIALTMTRRPGESRQGRRRRVDAWLEQMELGGMANRDPATFRAGKSAGGVGPPFGDEPRAVLLDEPFSALDPTLREATRHFIFRYLQAQCVLSCWLHTIRVMFRHNSCPQNCIICVTGDWVCGVVHTLTLRPKPASLILRHVF